MSPITQAITDAEAWDYSSTTLNNEIWRIWFGKVFNLLIIIMVSAEVALDSQILPTQQRDPPTEPFIGTIPWNQDPSVRYDCREDEIGI